MAGAWLTPRPDDFVSQELLNKNLILNTEPRSQMFTGMVEFFWLQQIFPFCWLEITVVAHALHKDFTKIIKTLNKITRGPGSDSNRYPKHSDQ